MIIIFTHFNHFKRFTHFTRKYKYYMYNSSLPLCRVSTDSVIPPDINVDSARVARLAASIRAVGLLCPVILRKCRRKYSIISGKHRFLALKMLDVPYIDALVITDPTITDEQIIICLPSERDPVTPVKPEPLILIRDIRPLYNTLSRTIDRMTASGIPSNVSCETFDEKTIIRIEIDRSGGMFHVKQ